MSTQEKSLEKLSQEHGTTTAAVFPGGRRPEGKTPAAAQPTPPSTTQVKASKPRRTFSTDYKLNVLAEYDSCDNALARGELLRKEGLYSSRISTWRKQLKDGKLGRKTKQYSRAKNEKQAREIKQLKKKLAQAEAVIDLQKKVSELLGQHILPHQLSEED